MSKKLVHLIHPRLKKTHCGISLANSPEPINAVTKTDWEQATCPGCKNAATVRELMGDRNPRGAGAKPKYGEKLKTINTKPAIPESKIPEFERKAETYGGKAKLLRDALLEKMASLD